MNIRPAIVQIRYKFNVSGAKPRVVLLDALFASLHKDDIC